MICSSLNRFRFLVSSSLVFLPENSLSTWTVLGGEGQFCGRDQSIGFCFLSHTFNRDMCGAPEVVPDLLKRKMILTTAFRHG